MIPKKVYCIGLGGVGVSAVAKFFLHQGATVAGSDPIKSPLVDDVIRLGGTYYSSPDPDRLDSTIDLVVYTDDCGSDHPERQAAKHLGLTSQNFSEALGQIMADYPRRIAVAGTNGKSTTTALTGLLLKAAGLDPTVFVGSRVGQFDGNLRYGGRQVFVAEADEYRDHFLNFHPTVATITNIELDHVNYFHSLQRMITSYKKFADHVDTSGKLVINIDDPVTQKTFGGKDNVVSFGLNKQADLHIKNLQTGPGRQTFDLVWQGKVLGHYALYLPGQFNVINVAAAVATALTAGASPATFATTIADFRGVWRRFEILSKPKSSVTVVNDYAHHPTAVRGTLQGARDFFPGRRILAVFQPHHHNRLTALFNDFAAAFDAADTSVIAEVYAVPGRQPEVGDNKTGQDLAMAVAERSKSSVVYAANADEASDQVKKIIKPGDVVIIMGAGDIWTTAEPLARFYE